MLLLIATLLMQASGGGFVAAVWMALGSPGTIHHALFNPWALSAVNIISTGSALVYGQRATGEPPARLFPVRAFPASLLPAMVLTALGLALLMNEVDNMIVEVLRLIPGFETDNSMMHILTADAAGAFLLLLIVAPWGEEFLFRGLVLRGLLRHHRPVTAVLLTALLFSLMHANLRQFFLAFVLGAVMGWWTVRTRSIAPAIIGHTVFNSVAYAASQFPHLFENFGFGSEKPGAHQAWWLTAGGTVLAALGSWWFHERSFVVIPPPPPQPEPPVIADPPLLVLPPTTPEAVRPPDSPMP